ncbi:MAG: transporter [bacterium]
MKIKLNGFFIFTLLFTTSLLGQTNQEIAATPQRPSFSTSTATTYSGWLELEAGVSVDKHLLDSPLVLKLGAMRNFELFVGLSPMMSVSNGSSKTGFGDMAFGGRVRFKESTINSPSLAGQFSIKLPTADESKGLGTGEVDFNFLFILSQSFGNVGMDFNMGFSILGNPEGGNNAQILGILTFSRLITAKFSGYGEIYVNHGIELDDTESNSFENDEAVFIGAVGVSYSPSALLVFDAAFNFNLSNAPFDFQVLAGVTATLTRFW